jgi:hypothetical protein
LEVEKLTEELVVDTTTLSLVLNAALGILSVYLAKHMGKLRQIKELAICLINSIDDHEISKEEVDDIVYKIEELV